VGKALIERVLDTLTSHPSCRAIHIMIEPDGMAGVKPFVESLAHSGPEIRFIASDENIAESVLVGCRDAQAPYIITTADNVLLSHSSIDKILAALDGTVDALAGLAKQADIQAVHPKAQRSFYAFKDGGYANCNLYAIAGPRGLGAAEAFREGGQFMNNPSRLVRAFGLFNILLMRLKLVTIDKAFERISRRLGVKLRIVHLGDGSQAIDVDNQRTYEIARGVLDGSIVAPRFQQ